VLCDNLLELFEEEGVFVLNVLLVLIEPPYVALHSPPLLLQRLVLGSKTLVLLLQLDLKLQSLL
jgi:hypothetical protein